MDFRHLLEQAQNLERALADLEEKLAAHEVRASSGGGAVEVVANGAGDVVSLKLDPELLKEDVSLVQDTLLEALRQATAASRTFRDTERARLTGGLKLPEF
ncbi:MAG: nucleoid-associated protein [Planctomycetota bacterium]|nr:MAG: nucleoid-associated protein [Planctomycetota bacterium]